MRKVPSSSCKLYCYPAKKMDGVRIIEINENDIQDYLNLKAREGVSSSQLNQILNAIKFYYETVKEMPNRFYSIDRPFKEERLPKVLSAVLADAEAVVH